jgi:hypothetical protein
LLRESHRTAPLKTTAAAYGSRLKAGTTKNIRLRDLAAHYARVML